METRRCHPKALLPGSGSSSRTLAAINLPAHKPVAYPLAACTTVNLRGFVAPATGEGAHAREADSVCSIWMTAVRSSAAAFARFGREKRPANPARPEFAVK
jgi:hypothetical protein